MVCEMVGLSTISNCRPNTYSPGNRRDYGVVEIVWLGASYLDGYIIDCDALAGFARDQV